MAPAFIPALTLPARTSALPTHTSRRPASSPRMSAKDVVDENYPLYERYRAPVITVKGDVGVSVGMEVIPAFCEIDKNTPPLLDYSDEFEFEPNKPLPPSAISWPSGDGRGNDLKGVRSFFTQPNLKTYGPFPDFFKRSCDG